MWSLGLVRWKVGYLVHWICENTSLLLGLDKQDIGQRGPTLASGGVTIVPYREAATSLELAWSPTLLVMFDSCDPP